MVSFTSDVQRYIAVIKNEPNGLSQEDFEAVQELIIGCAMDKVRTNAGLFASLCHSITESLVATKKSVLGIHLMISALEKLRNSKVSQLTSIHSDLCLLCLDSKCLNPALPYLNTDYTEIHLEDGQLELKHVLLYHYYGGMILTALKLYEKALHYFEMVLVVAVPGLASIVVEAHKKHILLTLLIHGKYTFDSLPKFTPICVTRQSKSIGPGYIKLLEEYDTLNYERIRKVIVAHTQSFERDENLGLAKQCLTRVKKRCIQRLTKTFLTLSLSDVATYVEFTSEREAENFILNMIEEGEIFATISQNDGMVVFYDNPERFESATVFQKLQADMKEGMHLIKTLEVISSNRE